MKNQKWKYLTESISLLFTILFLYTATSKLMEYNVFKEQIATSTILAPISSTLAVTLPLLEIVIAFLLFVPRSRLVGLYLSLGLMIVFTGYIIAMLSFNEHVPCSCGGIIEKLSWKSHIILNSSLIALALAGIFIQRSTRISSSLG
jgi:hypothetical protein